MAPAPCPNEDVLSRFALGSIDDGERATVEGHLDECDACRLVVAAAAPPGARDVPDPLPRTLVRYRLEEVLGRGGMGVVYRASDTVLERDVAVKMLQVAGDDVSRDRLLREARAMAKLSHPNVVTVHDFGEAGGDVFIAMELVEGTRLDHWLADAPRSPGAVLARFLEAGRGLAAAHAAGLVHRDFKPANVLVGADERARVTDFGLSRIEQPSEAVDAPLDQLTRSGSLIGTPAYMAPEQLDGGAFDARTDQFAFCVALTEALGNRRPWTATTTVALRAAMMSPPTLSAELPARVSAVVRRGLAIDPARRFPSMQALLTALAPPSPRRGLALVIALGVAVLALGGVVASLALRAPPAVIIERPPRESVELLPGEGLISLHLGERKTVWIPGVDRVAVGNTDIVDTELAGENVMAFIPVTVGRTTVLAWTQKERRSFVVVVKPAEPPGKPAAEP